MAMEKALKDGSNCYTVFHGVNALVLKAEKITGASAVGRNGLLCFQQTYHKINRRLAPEQAEAHIVLVDRSPSCLN